MKELLFEGAFNVNEISAFLALQKKKKNLKIQLKDHHQFFFLSFS